MQEAKKKRDKESSSEEEKDRIGWESVAGINTKA